MNTYERDTSIAPFDGELEESHYFHIVTMFCTYMNEAIAEQPDINGDNTRKLDLLIETMIDHLSDEACDYLFGGNF